MNPLASHWFRIGAGVLLASPLIALLVDATTGSSYGLALTFTLYMSFVVCVILALIATAGLAIQLVGKGVRALRK